MWSWFFYAALALGFVSVAAALAHLATRLLQAWRDLRRFRGKLADELDRLATLGEAAADTAARAADTARLQESHARFRVTLARYAVLRSAVGEVTDMVGRVAAVYPRK